MPTGSNPVGKGKQRHLRPDIHSKIMIACLPDQETAMNQSLRSQNAVDKLGEAWVDRPRLAHGQD